MVSSLAVILSFGPKSRWTAVLPNLVFSKLRTYIEFFSPFSYQLILFRAMYLRTVYQKKKGRTRILYRQELLGFFFFSEESILYIIYFSVRERAEFSKSCNLIGDWLREWTEF